MIIGSVIMNQQKSIFIIIFLFCLLISFSGCAPEMPTHNPINKEWHYAIGTKTDTVMEAADYSYKKLNSFSTLNKLHPNGKGIIWFKNEFRIPESLKGKDLSLLLGFINPNDITFLNNVKIGSTGLTPFSNNHFFSDWNSYRKYDIHNSNLKEETNTLLIKYYTMYEGSIEGKIALGDRETINQIYNVEYFFRTGINAIIAAVMILIGLYHLLIFFKRKEDKENLYYSLLCIFLSIYQLNFFITQTPFNIHYILSYFVFQKIILVSLYFSCLTAIFFIISFLDIKTHKVLKILILLFYSIAIAITIGAPEYKYISLYSKIVNAIVALPTFLIFFSLTIVMAIKKNRTARVLLIGLLPFAICIFFDVITHNILQKDDFIYVTGLGFSAFLISIMFVLANDFVSYHNEVEDLNISLDKKVEDRTKELQDTKNEIEIAYKELESTNNDLLSAHKELEETHTVIKKDMEMAANLQASFFPKKAPNTDEWETAFIFKPMAEVSGDFYDFFIVDEKLYGTALFDVSGHGIASGLITMIAKSVLIRNFTRYREMMLNQLMQRINRDLIHEIGNVDNYVTGILLRLINDKIEYVNAGHTDLFIKNGQTGEVKIVQSEDKSFRGHFLGIEAMDEAYTLIRFKVKPGDTLFLFTDCLTESINSSGEEYGIDRLLKIFSQLGPDLPAQVQLDAIIKDLYQHIGSEELRDDLTAITLKKVR